MMGPWIAGINPVEKICSGVPTVAGLDSLLTVLSSLKTPLAKMAGARSDMGTASGALLSPSTVTCSCDETPGVSPAGNSTVMLESSPDCIAAGVPSKVTDTFAPFRCDPLMIAKDPGETAVELGRAALATLCRRTLEGVGVGVGTGVGVGVGLVGGNAVTVNVMGSVWLPACG